MPTRVPRDKSRPDGDGTLFIRLFIDLSMEVISLILSGLVQL